MVIYLKIRKVWSFSLVLLFIVFIYLGGYYISYLKYNDYSIIKSELLIQENQYLLKELKNIDDISIKYDNCLVGKVLYRDIYSFYEEIVINLGKDKVDVGDAVVNNEGLIGIIYKTGRRVSYVKLISSDYNVSVLINGDYGNLNNGIISLLDKYSDIKVGDLVYTSNYGDVLEGIYVGKVKSISYDSDELGKKAEIEIVDNKNLNYVGILKKAK